LTFRQRHTTNLTSGQFGLMSRHSSLRNKKIKTPPPHKKKLNFYCRHTLHTFAFASQHTSQPEGKVKRVQSPTLYKMQWTE
jgi:hypothetical protein